MAYQNPYFNADWMKPQPSFSAADRFRFNSEVALPGKTPISFEQGLNYGLGALGLGTQIAGMANQSLGLPQIPTQNFESGQAPVYGLGGAYNQVLNSNPQGAQAGEILSGVATGYAFGGPVGAAVGGLGTLIGGAFRKDKQQAEKRRATRRLEAGQNAYNTATNQYIQGQNIREDYLDQLTRRSANLFKLP